MLRDTVLLISRGAICSSAYQTFVKEIPIYFYYLSKYSMSLFFSHKYKDFKDLTGLNQDCVSGTLADLDSPPIHADGPRKSWDSCESGISADSSPNCSASAVPDALCRFGSW